MPKAITTLQLKNQAKWIAANSQDAFDKLSAPLKYEVRKGRMSVGIGRGQAQGSYPGSILEKHLDDIKKEYLKGAPQENIFASNKLKYKSNTSVARAIESMKNGLAPITISTEEFSKRPSTLSKITESYNKLKKNLKDPPLSQN